MNTRKTILLVDDDVNLLAMVGDFLEGEGYDVVKAENGEKALTLLRGITPNLIILDMMMPGMGGIGVLEHLALPDGTFRYPILVLTAKAAMSEFFADKQVDGFLAKPCNPEDLALEVSRIIFQSSTDSLESVYGQKPMLYLADPQVPRRHAISAGLAASGYSVLEYGNGAELIQAAVLSPPTIIAMPLELGDQPASVIAGIIKAMEATAASKVLVYGIGLPGTQLDDLVALDNRKCHAIPGDGVSEVVAGVADALVKA